MSVADNGMMQLAVILAVLVVAALIGVYLPSYYTGLMTDCLVFAIFALGLNLLLGYAGLPSLGHAAFFGTGAYATGLLSVYLSNNLWLGLAAGVGAAALLGAVFALLALRTSGVYFLIITLALAQIAWAVAYSWRHVTGGDDGLAGVARPELGFLDIGFDERNAFFLLALVVFGVALVLLRAMIRSPFGHALRGVQESPVRMAAMGYNVWLFKYLAFVISCAFAGLAGVVFVYYKGFVSPEAMSIVVSAEVMLMVILGGAATLAGPVIGAFTIVLLSNFVSAYTDRWPLILGVFYVLVVIAAPNGVVGALKRAFLDAGRRS